MTFALGVTAVSAVDDEASLDAQRLDLIERMRGTDQMRPDGATYRTGGMSVLTAADLHLLGLRRGTGACSGEYELADATPGDGCTHGVDLPATAEAVQAAAACGLIDCPAPPGYGGIQRIPCYTTGPFVDVLYVHWGTSRLPTYAEAIRRSVAGVDELFRVSAAQVKSSGGVPGNRHVRWGMTGGCKLRITSAAMGSGIEHQFGAVKDELVRQGIVTANRKYLAYVDDGSCLGGIAERSNSSIPGATNPSNKGGHLAIVIGECFTSYHPYAGYGAAIAAHELMHTLGAVQNDAPHTTKGHCWDDAAEPHQGADIMCYQDGLGTPTSKFYQRCTRTYPERFDCGVDDYFNPYPKSGTYLATHWNTARNVFLSSSDPATWDPIVRPTVALTPSTGPIAGLAKIKANLTVPTGLTASVRFQVTGQNDSFDATSPYEVYIPTDQYRRLQTLTVKATATDSLDLAGPTVSTTFTVANPMVHLDSPPDQLFVAPKSVPWTASAIALSGRTIDRVELWIDDQKVVTDATKPYGGTVDLSPYLDLAPGVNEPVRLGVLAFDSAGDGWASYRTVYVRPPTFRDLYLSGAQVPVGEPTRLRADVERTPGVPIDRVEFLVNNTLVGTDTTAPYGVDWTPQSIGTKTVTVRAVDKSGYVYAGPSDALQVVDGHGATVAITTPTEGATPGFPIALAWTIDVPDGSTLTSVDAYLDGGWSGSVGTTSPTTLDPIYDSGVHDLRLDAWLNDGVNDYMVSSANRAFRLGGALETVAISGVAEGATIRQTVTLGISTTLDMNQISRVWYYHGGELIGASITAPFTIQWDTRTQADGLGRITANVEIGDGFPFGTTPVRTVTKKNLYAWFTSPLPNQVVSGTVPIRSSGRCDRDCTILNAAFLIDGVIVKRDTTAPYGFDWDSTTVADGAHTYAVTYSTDDARTVSTTNFPFTVDNVP